MLVVWHRAMNDEGMSHSRDAEARLARRLPIQGLGLDSSSPSMLIPINGVVGATLAG